MGGGRVFRHNPDENENIKLAHKYKIKRENAFLLQNLNKISSELKDIKMKFRN